MLNTVKNLCKTLCPGLYDLLTWSSQSQCKKNLDYVCDDPEMRELLATPLEASETCGITCVPPEMGLEEYRKLFRLPSEYS